MQQSFCSSSLTSGVLIGAGPPATTSSLQDLLLALQGASSHPYPTPLPDYQLASVGASPPLLIVHLLYLHGGRWGTEPVPPRSGVQGSPSPPQASKAQGDYSLPLWGLSSGGNEGGSCPHSSSLHAVPWE